MIFQSHVGRPSIILGLGLLLLAMQPFAAGVASARTEVMRWTHPAPGNLVRFEALVGTSSQNYGAPISVGLPQSDADGIFTASIVVADEADVFLAIQAVDDTGLVSVPSNERFRAAPSSGGGAVEPPNLADGTEIPANPDAVVRLDFDSGSAPNWLDTGADNSMVEDDSLFSVVSVGGNPALTTQSSSLNIHSHFVGNPSNLQNLTLTGRMAIETTDGGVGITVYSQYPNSDIYYRLLSAAGNNSFAFKGHPFATSNCEGDLDTGIVPQPGVWYEFELTIVNEGTGNRMTAAVWKQGDPKPNLPQANCIDTASNRPLSGTVGVWSGGTGAKYWDDLEVVAITGSAGPAVPPDPPILMSVEPAN